MKIKFLGENCELVKSYYKPNGRVALYLLCEDKSPMATATVNLPTLDLASDEVFIKDYSENEGILKALTQAGVVQDTGKRVNSGFVEIPICKLLI